MLDSGTDLRRHTDNCIDQCVVDFQEPLISRERLKSADQTWVVPSHRWFR